MKCQNAKLCNKLVISSSITVDGANLVINIPQNAFPNCHCGCLVIAQTLPTEATIDSPVVITIGDDTTTTYPLINKYGAAVTASNIKPRTRYPFQVITTPTSANFKLLCGTPCSSNNLPGIPVVTTTTGG